MKCPWAVPICLAAVLAAAPASAQNYAPRPLAAAPTSSPPANIHPAVARIVAPGNGSISYGSGTLVYADEYNALVITNWHVVNEATGPISVHFPDGFYSIGTIQRADKDWDLAAIAIRRPNAQPVALANVAPRPGDMLTIAGYGSGNYRAVSGRCTQYVAPGTTFPFEMIELAASARQGDSGGPIFNNRGELAGVLFGEGHGRTAGSYCGRVRWFVSSVVPNLPGGVAQAQIAQAPLTPVGPRPLAVEKSRPRQVASTPTPGERLAAPHTLQSASPVVHASASSRPAVPAAVASAPAAGPLLTDPPLAVSHDLGWEDLAGHTLGEQIKTVMAAVGGLAVLLHTLRWLSSEKGAAKTA